ncbi:MAG: ROK family protein [Jiangellaceae bacterium]
MRAGSQGEPVVLALDVGGTTVEAAVVGSEGAIRGEVLLESPDDADAAAILDCFGGLLTHLRRRAEAAGQRPVAAGLGMPGPFDYPRGVSRMRHKLAAVRGLDLRAPLEAAVELPVYFFNDATAFAIGAWWHEHSDEPRLIGLTIGTGLGSGFVVAGRPVAMEEGAPSSGELWDFPFRGGILEDAVSGRAVSRSYRRRSGQALEAGEIAGRARAGDVAALEAFTRLGEALGEGLAAAAAPFGPTRVVCGGQIAKAFDLFGSRAQAAYRRLTATDVVFSAPGNPHLALLGVARCLAWETL